MRRRLRDQWAESTGAGIEERLDDVSADLPYELQSKMFDQLAGLAVAGAGLTVTLIGSLLREAPPVVWLAVVEFAAAAFVAITGNNQLIDGLFRKKPALRRGRVMTLASLGLIGMAIGSLSMSVYHEGRPHRHGDASAGTAPAADEGR